MARKSRFTFVSRSFVPTVSCQKGELHASMALLGFTDRIRSMRKSGSGLPALKIEIPDKKGLAVLIAVERAEELDGTPLSLD